MKKKVRVVTTTKGHTYDPQGAAVLRSLQQLGIKHIEDVKIGRHILLYIEDGAPEEEIMPNVIDATNKLLHNDIIEDFEIIDK